MVMITLKEIVIRKSIKSKLFAKASSLLMPGMERFTRVMSLERGALITRDMPDAINSEEMIFKYIFGL
jgi:hypothetical protein